MARIFRNRRQGKERKGKERKGSEQKGGKEGMGKKELTCLVLMHSICGIVVVGKMERWTGEMADVRLARGFHKPAQI